MRFVYPLSDLSSAFLTYPWLHDQGGLAVLAGSVALAMALLWWRERRRRAGLTDAVDRGLQRERVRRHTPAALRNAIDQLRENAQLAQGIFASSPDAILVMDPSDEQEPLSIVMCSDVVCLWHRWQRDELIGRSVNLLERDPTRWTAAEAAELVSRLRVVGMERGEIEHRRKDGSVFPVEFTNSLLVVGGREYVLGFDRDITVRRGVESALRASEERFRAIFNASPTGMQLQDPHDREVPMRIVDANRHAAEMHGVRVEDMIGRSMGDFDASPVSYETAQAWLARLRAARSVSGEAIHRRADGSEFPIDYIGTFVVLDGREFILGIDRDITERKRMDTELNESRRLRAVGAMVGGIAHEFNNLLTPMLLHVDLLLSPGVNPGAVQAAARPLRQAVTQASDLTRRILAFGRHDDAPREQCDVSEVVRDAVNLMGKTIDRRIRLTVESSASGWVRARRTDLSQIVINLLLNARDAVIEKGAQNSADWSPVIEVKTDQAEPVREHRAALGERPPLGWVRLRVTDNGTGMNEAVRERVFEPFFTTKPTGRGTGLGLATVWHLVRAENGHVIIDSRLGEGTTMNIYLPAAAASTVPEAAQIASIPDAELKEPKRTGLRVLLVEDQDLVGGSVEGLLVHYGHEVRWIMDGAEAWTWIEANQNGFDILITDLNLPGLSGSELVERVRGVGFKGKIIAYSGMILPEVESRLRRAGIHGLLAKPFQINQLLELLRE